MRKSHLLALLALVATPALAGKTATDGYHFTAKAMDNTDLEVQVITYPSQQALFEAWAYNNPRRPRPGRIIGAFSQLEAKPTPGRPRLCRIHIIDPIVAYYPERIGHELAHCIFGDFHPVEVE